MGWCQRHWPSDGVVHFRHSDKHTVLRCDERRNLVPPNVVPGFVHLVGSIDINGDVRTKYLLQARWRLVQPVAPATGQYRNWAAQ